MKLYLSILSLIFASIALGQQNTNRPANLPIDKYYKAAVRIHNPNTVVMQYKYRWGNGEWQSTSLQPFQTWVHHYHYYRGNYNSPAFNIRYDRYAGDGKFTPYIQELARTKVKKSELSKAQTYFFKYAGNQILLHAFKSYDINYVAAVKIENRTNRMIHYEWKWKDSKTWNKVSLKPGWNRWFSKYYYPRVYHSPAYQIRFDRVLGDGKTSWQYYDLDRNKCLKSKAADNAKLYVFESRNPSVVDLYKGGN